jgi:hypothetical protein
MDLPEPQPIELTPVQLTADELQQTPAIEEPDVPDEEIRKEYSTWLDWNLYRLFTSFTEKAPYQRARAVDFLTTMGILDNQNSHWVRVQNSRFVERTIEEFDALDTTGIALIPITHLLPDDETTDFIPERFTRTTALLEQFLRDLGEPMELSDEVARRHQLPLLKTTVPIIPSVACYGALVAPSMGKTEDDAKKIAQEVKNSLIHIIFNETDLQYNPPAGVKENRFVLVIRPTLKGFYYVWQIHELKEVLSPFAQEQTMSAQTIAFNLAVLLELSLPLQVGELVPNIVEKRVRLLGQLCPSLPDEGLAATASARFLESLQAMD